MKKFLMVVGAISLISNTYTLIRVSLDPSVHEAVGKAVNRAVVVFNQSMNNYKK